MPAYDYKCPDCGKTREVRHRMCDMVTVACECGQSMFKRPGGSIYVQFNGPGFYRNSERKKVRAEVKPA